MANTKPLNIFIFFLFILSSVSGSDFLLNFTEQTTQYNKTYSDIVSVSEFPEFSFLESNYPSSIYTLINSNIFSKIAFYKNSSGSFDSGYYGIYKPNVFFKNGFPSGYLNKSLLYIEQFSLSSGSPISFILLDLKINQSVFNQNNKSSYEVFFKVIDRQSGITDYLSFVFLSGNLEKYRYTILFNSTDKYNYTLNITPNSTFNFDRFVLRQDVNVGSGVIQDLGIESINFKNISLVENRLPDFNFSVSGDFCINTSKKNDKTIVYFNISAYDFEGDTILYSLEKQTENLKEVNTYHKTGTLNNYCGLYIPILDIFVFENLNIFCKGKDSKITIDLNPQLYNEFLSNRCKIDFSTSENLSNIYIEKFTGINGDNYMLVIPDNCTGLEKEAVYKLETGLKSFQYETQFYYQKPLQQIKINFYNSLNPKILIANFTISYWLGSVFFQNQNNTILYTLSNPANFSYDYNMLVSSFVFDYETNKFYINISDGVNNFSISTNGSLTPNSTKYLKYIGFGTGGLNTNYRLLQEIFTISAYYDKLDFSSQKPNNISYTELKNDYLTLFVSDSYNKELDIYNSKSQAISIKSCDYKSESANIKFDVNDFCPKYSSTAINNIICALRTPAIIGYQLNTLHFFNDILILFLIYMVGSLYMKFASETTGFIDTSEIIRRTFIISFLVVFSLYYFFMLGDKNIFVGFSLIGILMLGFSFNKILHLESSSIEENFFYSTLWFNLFAFIFFSFVQTPVYSNFGIKEFPNIVLSLNPTTLFNNLKLVGDYIVNIFFFSIPDLNSFLKLFFGLFRIISIISFITIISKRFGDSIKYILDYFKGFF